MKSAFVISNINNHFIKTVHFIKENFMYINKEHVMEDKVKVDQNKAQKILYSAYDKAIKFPEATCLHKGFIDFVLDNTHLTYKYVLVNALLAKATNPESNPLCLQKKSKLPGAYDARTICHKVLVPFEKEELGKALGGSNEPFLNKPARFTELNETNAVRAGRDKEILNSLCNNLPTINNSYDAYNCLVYALTKLIKVKEQKAALTKFKLSNNNINCSATKLYVFLNELLNKNYEGEVLTLVIAGIYEQFMHKFDDYFVEVHPVNESGASSKEVSDLDVYLNKKLFISNELKDKEFSDHDLSHAADKVIEAGIMRMNFIVGRHGGCPEEITRAVTESYFLKGFILNIITVDQFIITMLTLIDNIDIENFLKYILQTARDTKFKETTIKYILDCAKKCLELDA